MHCESGDLLHWTTDVYLAKYASLLCGGGREEQRHLVNIVDRYMYISLSLSLSLQEIRGGKSYEKVSFSFTNSHWLAHTHTWYVNTFSFMVSLSSPFVQRCCCWVCPPRQYEIPPVSHLGICGASTLRQFPMS